jgi:hypothetical protein
MLYYLYCVARELPEFENSLLGVLDRHIELISFDEFVVVVSRVDDETLPVTRENVLRHEAVVRQTLVVTTPLPFRFGSTATTEGLHGFVDARRAGLIERLNALQGCVEMSVKVIWNKVSAESAVKPDPKLETLGAGAAFLMSKREELLGDEKLGQQARELKEWIGRKLSSIVRSELVNVQPKEKLVFAGSYLVERAGIAGFREKLAKAMSERPELHFLTSGPWPPYSFANIDLEFKTHFGVS